ncbi:MAG: hypothetical protein JXB30_09660 [Anaerolineae bacterium]|nr:hypothetical protein [Anaerolineae bacterium]
MKTNRWQVLVVFAMMILAALACEASFSTASIDSAVMAADEDGTQETTVFAADQTFYCIVTLANAPEDTKVRAVWTAVDAEGEDPNLEMDQSELTIVNENVLTFSLSNEGLWPSGTYKVDLYLNDELDRTLEFTVQ